MKEFSFEVMQRDDTKVYLCSYKIFDPFLYLDYLSESEKERMFTFKHVKRRREFIATRILRHSIFGFKHIHYNQHGAPYIEDAGFISISHCKNLVGIALNEHYKIGLDLESPRENIGVLSHKFLSDHELKSFEINNSLELTKIWSAKEALYKLAGRKQIIFKEELLLTKLDNDNWQGQIVNEDHDLFVNLDIFEFNKVIVSLNKGPIVKKPRNI
ncbi:MAG: 4'-phosphopantetheinyl transferase superfamily protein [Crocinitomicaceae bacterium]|nr:4'-phosphopantetheinyl transferase superfamily protein [Crocinitomicaceae bacterium]